MPNNNFWLVMPNNNFWLFVTLLLAIVSIVSMWFVFTKAGHPGWAALIPFYNVYIMLKIAGKPGWWLLLMLIPLVNLVVSALMLLGLAENFGKGAGFALGLLLIPIVFLPILAFDDSKYLGPEHNRLPAGVASNPWS